MSILPAFTDSTASLKPTLIRRSYPGVVAPRRRFGTATPMALPAVAVQPESSWAADLRFFLICYLAGFSFFLIMLS